MNDDRFSIQTLGAATRVSPIARTGGARFVADTERILFDPHWSAVREHTGATELPEGFEVAGPRRDVFFDPTRLRAAIVTCGGLCPGINAVIRGLVLQLWHQYQCRDIIGVRYGYGGLAASAQSPIALGPDQVREIHMTGGTMLGTSRGTPSTQEIVDGLEHHRIDVLFTIGGDGTMRGASAIWNEVRRRGLNVSVIGVPKTIDNDIPFVRRSFGFDTAVGIATQAVAAAHVEARGAPYGVGLVKLMGRHSGYITANATLASGDANYCLVPEVTFSLEGNGGLLELLEKRLRDRQHAVIVVAEGAGQYYFQDEPRQRDASGNVKLGDIGTYFKQRITKHFSSTSLPVTLKYIDPSYLIRAAPANPADQLFCARLAQNAVHAALAGKSGMLIGYWHGQMTHVPLQALEGNTQTINPQGELWFNVRMITGQPSVIGRLEHIETSGPRL